MKSTIDSTSEEIITVVIADDQLTIRQSLQSKIMTVPDIAVVAHADNGLTAIEKVAEFQPNIIIIDLEMPNLDGIAAISQISDRFPETKCLVFTSHDERKYINQAIIAGAKGYLLKGTATEDLIEAIRKINRGYFQLGSGLLDKISLANSHSSLSSGDVAEKKLWESQLISQLESKLNQNIQNLIAQQQKNQDFSHLDTIEKTLALIIDKQIQTNTKLNKIEVIIYLLLFWQVVTLIICLALI